MEEVRGLPRPDRGWPDSPRGRPADDAGGVDGHRRPDAAAPRDGAQEGRDGRAPEGADRHPDPHAGRAGQGVVPEPVAQLPAGGSSRRQGRGTALRHLRALPHGGQDLLVPDDPRPLDEAARLPPRRRADGHPADARDALDCRSRRGARVPRAEAALRQGLVGARGEARRCLGRVRSRARQRRVPGRGPDHRRRQRRVQADRQPHLHRRHRPKPSPATARSTAVTRCARGRRTTASPSTAPISFPATRFAASRTSRPRTSARPARNGCAAAAAPRSRASCRRSCSRARRPRSPSRA